MIVKLTSENNGTTKIQDIAKPLIQTFVYVFTLAGCVLSMQQPQVLNDDDETVGSSPSLAYMQIINTLDPVTPGKGYDYYARELELEYPMAYSLILSAEAARYNSTGEQDALDRCRLCGTWLLEKKDLNNDGTYGYGLPFAVDAFSDGSINLPHTEYTITSSIAMKGLMDWI